MSAVDIFIEPENYYVGQEYEKSLELFKTIEDAFENGDVQNYIGLCYMQLNNYDAAIKCFQDLIRKYPEWAGPV